MHSGHLAEAPEWEIFNFHLHCCSVCVGVCVCGPGSGSGPCCALANIAHGHWRLGCPLSCWSSLPVSSTSQLPGALSRPSLLFLECTIVIRLCGFWSPVSLHINFAFCFVRRCVWTIIKRKKNKRKCKTLTRGASRVYRAYRAVHTHRAVAMRWLIPIIAVAPKPNGGL